MSRSLPRQAGRQTPGEVRETQARSVPPHHCPCGPVRHPSVPAARSPSNKRSSSPPPPPPKDGQQHKQCNPRQTRAVEGCKVAAAAAGCKGSSWGLTKDRPSKERWFVGFTSEKLLKGGSAQDRQPRIFNPPAVIEHRRQGVALHRRGVDPTALKILFRTKLY